MPYLEAGQGPPVVLLHGAGDDATTWRRLVPELARSHRVLAPSFPGFDGEPRGDSSPASLAAFVEDFLDSRSLPRAALVGSSLGGLVAIRAALASPDRVPALALVASAGLGREVSLALRLTVAPPSGEASIALGRTGFGAWQRATGRALLLFSRPDRVPRDWLADQVRLARRPGALEATVAALRHAVDMSGQRDAVLGELPRLDVPTLVLWGTRDRVLPPSHAAAAAERLPNGRAEILERCGHLPHVERPAAVAAALRRLLDAAGGR